MVTRLDIVWFIIDGTNYIRSGEIPFVSLIVPHSAHLAVVIKPC